MLYFIIVFTAIISALHLRALIMTLEDRTRPLQNTDDVSGGGGLNLSRGWTAIMDEYGLPFAHYCVSVTYAIYMRLTLINMAIFILKYVPTGFYMYKFVKDVYLKSRERVKLRQIELEDIQLQIQIVNTKLGVRDAKFTERAEQLRRDAERLRKVRARVHEVIATDDVLRRALEGVAQWDADHDVHLHNATQEEDREFILELLKEMKHDHLAKPEKSPEKPESGEYPQADPNAPENSVYSSLSDIDARQDCRIKIVKVTNVYKVAYLKHYIKQKRLLRATKQAMLKKKMESIKKLLEDWQKTLNMVINSKLTILNIDSVPMDVASQEAMGDYSKTRGSVDSDSDLRNRWSDMYDEYNLNWAQNPYKPYAYNYEDVPDGAVPRDMYDSQDYGDVKYPTPPMYCDRVKGPNMSSIIEETKSETDEDYECRDVVAL